MLNSYYSITIIKLSYVNRYIQHHLIEPNAVVTRHGVSDDDAELD